MSEGVDAGDAEASEDPAGPEGGEDRPSVLIVGGGVAGLSASIFTARAGLRTTVVSTGESILARNAHLENYPGFPAGIDPRLLLTMIEDQAERAGVEFVEGRVTALERVEDEEFEATLASGDAVRATCAIAASWSDPGYLADLPVDLVDRGSKEFVDAAPLGRTGVAGLYAAGRLAEEYHQAIVAAGDGARAAITLLEDAERPFYHDWVAPEGYFTGRDREVPPGCEEIDEAERRRRDATAREVIAEYLAEPHPGEPTMHPSVAEEE